MATDTLTPPETKTALVSISEGARLVGKSRPVLYSRNKDGLLSFTRDSEGKKAVAVSELIRCFGSIDLPTPPTLPTDGPTSESTLSTPSPTAAPTPVESQTSASSSINSQYLDQLRKTMSLQKELALVKEAHARETQLHVERLEDLKTQVDDYRQETDHWRKQANDSIKLLTYEQEQNNKSWLARLFGR